MAYTCLAVGKEAVSSMVRISPFSSWVCCAATIWVRERIASFNDVPEQRSFVSLGMFPSFS